MIARAVESLKFAFNNEYANLAVSFFYAFVIATYFIQPEGLRSFDTSLVLITNLIFFNLIHVLFQYWLLETSEQYRSMVYRNIGIKSVPYKMIWASAFLVAVLYALKSSEAAAVWLKIFVVGWASQHSFGQTYGLYCAKRLNGASPGSDFKDIRALKYFVGFAVFTQLFLAIEGNFNFLPPAVEKPLYIGFMALIFVWIGSVAIYVLKQPRSPAQLGWMFVRFFMVGLSCVNPIALIALFAIHGAEYFDVARKVGSRSERSSARPIFWIVFASAIFALVALELYIYIFEPPAKSTTAILLSSFALSLTMIHYLFDSFAYKMKHAESRKNLIQLLH